MRRFEICVGRFHDKLVFSDLRLLLTKKQNISDIALYSGYYERGLQENRRGDPLKTKKVGKKSQHQKKIWKGDPLVSSGFVCYVSKVKNEREDPLR